MRMIVRAAALLAFSAWMALEVVKATLLVARDILAPTERVAPAVVIAPLRARPGLETTLLASLISLTPGTLTVGIEPGKGEIWVHGLYGRDPDQLRAAVADLQQRLLRAVRAGEED